MLNAFKIIDLTQTINSKSPTWEGCCGFSVEKKLDYDQCTGPTLFCVQKIEMLAGIGTHMDAPSHCFSKSIDSLGYSLDQLLAPAISFNIEDRAHESYALSPEDIFEFEKKHGFISPGCIVLIHTGWQKYWQNPERYRNELKFPHVSEAAAKIFIKRKILGLAIDTLSPDSNDSTFPVHHLLLEAGYFIVENMCNGHKMPAKGGFVLVAPLKGEGLTEAPIRLIGWVKNELT